MKRPARVFISYSHRDDELRQELEAHLAILRRQGLLETWHDRRITPGAEWAPEIDRNLLSADLVLLLVSAYFLASDYCYEKELGAALSRHADGHAIVIPIFLRPCDWQGAPFAHLQGLPSNASPVTSFADTHAAWTEVAMGIRRALEGMPHKTAPKSTTATTREVGALTSHLTELVREYESAMWTARSISLVAKIDGGQSVHLHDALRTWVRRQTPRCLFLLGDSGSGKTWALKRLAASLASELLARPDSSWVPIYAPLAKVPRQGHASTLMAAVPNLPMLLRECPNGLCLFMLDGLDEVAFHDEQRAERLLQDVVRDAPTGARFIVACRTQAFEAMPRLIETDFPGAASASQDRTDWAIAATLDPLSVYTIQPVDTGAADAFLAQGPSSRLWSAIHRKERYRALLRNPVMLYSRA